MISVVLPTYNRAKILTKSIESILAQTYENFELIIVDDGSLDNTEDVVAQINDSRIIYIRQENAGACVARNNGIDRAKGDYIAFQDSDDVWHSDKLEKQLETIQKKHADVVFSRMLRMKGNVVVGQISDYFSEGFLKKNDLPLAIGTQTLFGKREVFEKEKFDKEMPRFQEFELLLRIKKNYSIYSMKDALVDYFIQDDSISVNRNSYITAWNLILKKHPDFFEQYKSSRKRIARDIQLNAKLVKDPLMRRELAQYAFKFSKSIKTIARYIDWFIVHKL